MAGRRLRGIYFAEITVKFPPDTVVTMRIRPMTAAALVTTLVMVACGGGAPPQQGAATGSAPETATNLQINGAGATFPNPIYSKWFSDYTRLHPDVRINYQSIGSGGGIRQLVAQTVFFGASDTPMTDEQMKSAPGPVLHFPTVLGAVVPVYNLPGVTGLKFTGPMLADIY